MLHLRDPAAEFRVVSLARMAKDGRWRTEAMRSYTRPLLLWFTRGQGRITIAGTRRGYGAHNAVFLPAGTMHGFDMVGQVLGTALHFPAAMAADLPETPLHLRLRESRQQAEVTALIERIEAEAEARLPGAERALANYAGLLAVWLERHADLSDDALALGGPTAANRLTAAFTALVERDYRSAKGIAGYAAELGVTPTHLSRACRAACGKSALELVQDRLHYEARRMLRETDVPVKDIAARLGFTSAAYFSRAFHAQAGRSPSAFRRQA